MLLESIFQAFDGIAKSFGVFKVETVGDCKSMMIGRLVIISGCGAVDVFGGSHFFV